MASDLGQLQRVWERLGRADPMWAVLSEPGLRGGRWEAEEFYSTGRREIDRLMQYLESLPMEVRRGTALDFGCGLGRLTQPLSRHFEVAVGVDVAPSMIAQARAAAEAKGLTNCQFLLNAAPDLRLFDRDRFDLIYSNIVLQHIRPKLAKRYLVEMVRVLKPGGVLIFQLPAELKHPLPPLSVGRRLKRVASRVLPDKVTLEVYPRLRGRPPRRPPEPRVEMHGIPRRAVERLLERAGAEVVAVLDDIAAGSAWHGFRYTVTKPPSASRLASRPE